MDRARSYRREGWFGLRRFLKSILGWGPINAPARALLRACGGARWARFPVGLAEVAGTVEGGRFVMLDPLRCSNARELYWGGGRRLAACERRALDLFCRLGREAELSLDIGANTGLFSLAAAAVSPKLELHAFEIAPEVYVALYKNFARNDLLGRGVCHHLGVGRDGRVVRLPDTEAAGSLPLSFSSEWDTAGGRQVAFRSLDALLPAFGSRGRRAVVKIDVEGTEDEVFRHGEGFLKAFQPDIVCELLPGAAKVGFIEPLLKAHGYSFFKIADDALIAGERLAPDERFHDWLFTSRPERAR